MKVEKEGLPVAPIEAMAMKNIVVGSRISGIKDILKAFEYLLFEPSNVLDLKEKIEHVLSMSDTEKVQLEQTMRTHVEENYDLSKVVSQHEEFYKSVVK